MKILVLAPFPVYPPSHGGALRIVEVAKVLAARHEVTIASFEENPRAVIDAPPPPFRTLRLPWSPVQPSRLQRRFTRLGRLKRTPVSTANLDALTGAIGSQGIEVVIVENTSLALAPLLPALGRLPIVWVEHGIWSGLRHPSLRPGANVYRHLQNWIDYLGWRGLETWCWRQASLLVAVSREEQAEIRRRLGSDAAVLLVPNGVDVASYAALAPDRSSKRALFVGGRWYPNVEALQYFAREIHPRIRAEIPDFRLAVVGQVLDSPDLDLPAIEGIDRVGFVNDMHPVLATSRLSVVPVLRGHGTRLKILEAMAAGVPVVSTTKGAEGLDLRDGAEILLADRPETFAAAVVRLLRDAELCERIANAARRRARDYDWPEVTRPLEEALGGLSRARKAA